MELALTVTARAAAALRAELARSRVRFVRVLALGGGPSGLGFSLSLTAAPLSTDIVLEVAGLSLCVDAQARTLFGPLQIDYDPLGPNPAYVLAPPPATGAGSA